MDAESIQQAAGSRPVEEAGRAFKRRRLASHLGLTLPEDDNNGNCSRADPPPSPTLLETPSSNQVDSVFKSLASGEVVHLPTDWMHHSLAQSSTPGVVELPPEEDLECANQTLASALTVQSEVDRGSDEKQGKAQTLPEGGREGEGAASTSEGMTFGGNMCVRNLPKAWEPDQLKKLLADHNLVFHTVRKKTGWAYGFVSFANISQREAADAALLNLEVEGKKLVVGDAVARPEKAPNGKKVQHCYAFQEGNCTYGEACRFSHVLVEASAPPAPPTAAPRAHSQLESRKDIREAVTPLWAVPYRHQLARKQEQVHRALATITRKVLKEEFRQRCFTAWTKEAKQTRGGLACPLLGIVRSPVLEGLNTTRPDVPAQLLSRIIT